MVTYLKKQSSALNPPPLCYALLAVSLLFSGCTVGPDYQPPDTEKNIQIRSIQYPELRFEQTDLSHWWDIFNDTHLSLLINRAERNNLNLKIMLAKVDEARAAAGIEATHLYPTVDADGSVMQSRQSESVNPQATGDQTIWGLAIDAIWEIDLFGRIRRAMEASTADYEAMIEAHNWVLITLRAETASTYLRIRTLQAQLQTSRKNIKSQKSMLRLTRVRYKSGIATYLDVAQATQVLADTEADLPLIRSDLAKNLTSLGILVGTTSEALVKELADELPIPLPPAEVTIGIPAERVLQRPDIRKAERTLAAQTARIGVATAGLYPTFSLTGTLGFSALAAGDLLDSNSQAYGFGPTFQWNIFNMGRTRQQIAVQDARAEQAMHSYELAVQEAIKEVEDSLNSYHEQQSRVKALIHSVKAAKDTLRMSSKLYKDGLTGFQDVLDAQRSLLNAENGLDGAQGEAGIQLVGLYKSLAGGWTTEPLLYKEKKEIHD